MSPNKKVSLTDPTTQIKTLRENAYSPNSERKMQRRREPHLQGHGTIPPACISTVPRWGGGGWGGGGEGLCPSPFLVPLALARTDQPDPTQPTSRIAVLGNSHPIHPPLPFLPSFLPFFRPPSPHVSSPLLFRPCLPLHPEPGLPLSHLIENLRAES